MSGLSPFFAHLFHLFQKEAPKLHEVIQPEIDLFTSLLTKFAAVSLTNATQVITAGLSSGLPYNAAVNSGAMSLKADAIKASVEATEEELQLIANSLAKHQAKAINAQVAAAQAGAPPVTA